MSPADSRDCLQCCAFHYETIGKQLRKLCTSVHKINSKREYFTPATAVNVLVLIQTDPILPKILFCITVVFEFARFKVQKLNETTSLFGVMFMLHILAATEGPNAEARENRIE